MLQTRKVPRKPIRGHLALSPPFAISRFDEEPLRAIRQQFFGAYFYGFRHGALECNILSETIESAWLWSLQVSAKGLFGAESGSKGDKGR